MDSLDLLLVETERLEQSISSLVSSSLELESHKERSPALIDNTPGHRIQWAKNLHLEYILAIYLKPGTDVDGLSGVKNMTEQDITEACELFSIKMKDVFLSELMHLKSEIGGSKSTQEQSDKFQCEIQV